MAVADVEGVKGMKFSTAATSIQAEIAGAIASIRDEDIERLLAVLLEASRVFITGAGRVGLAGRAFTMRLMHLGLASYFVSDTTTPSIGPGDALLVCSGSGETASLRVVTELAVRHGARVVTITREPAASIARMACLVVPCMISDAGKQPRSVSSVQPMTTLFEQSLWLLLDAVVLMLMDRMKQADADMRQRHANLE